MAEGSFDPKDFENLEKNLKAAKRFSKDVNASFGNWARNFEKINDYGEAISDKVKLISELEEQIAKAGKDVTEEQLAQLANEKEKVKIMQSELKLMRKQISVTKTLKKETLGFLSKQTALIGKSLSMYNQVDKSVRDVSMNMGLSAQQMSSFRSSVGQVNVKFQELGYSAGEAAATQGAFAEETGRVAMLSNQTLGTMAELGKLTGMGAQAMGQFAGQMDAYGFSAEKSMEYTKEIMDVSQTMGVSSGKVIKKVQKNLSLLNKLDFKGGVKGMIKMAAYSEKYKISMEAVAGVAEKVFRPEGAIEAAANLQMLGGSLSQLGDPFDLMYKARYAPEELAKSLSQAASQSAVFNEKTGEFELNALELDRMREAASALGMDMGELVQTAKQTAKINMFKGMFTGMSPDDKETLAGMVQMKEGKAAITIDGQTKFVDDLNQTQIKGLLEQKKSSEKNAEIAQTTAERWTALQNQLLATLDPFIAYFDKIAREYVVPLGKLISEFPKTAAGLTIALAGLGKAAEWYMKGLWLGKGFNTATTGKGSFLKNILSGPKKLLKRVGGLFGMGKSSTDVVTEKAKEATSKSSKVSKGGGVGKSLKSLAKGLEAMGNVKVLFGAANLIPTAIGMVAMVPAIPTLLVLGNVGMKSLYKNLSAIGRGLSMMGNPKALLGTLTLTAAALGFTLMTAGLLGLGGVALLGEAAGIGLTALGAGLASFGATAGTVGWLGIAVLAALGATMLMFAGAVYVVAMGVALVVDSFTNMFSVIGENGSGLFQAGLGFMAMGAGIGLLTLSLISLGASMPIAMVGLLLLGGTMALLMGTANQLAAVDFKGMVDGVNNLNTENLEKLKELTRFLGEGKPIKIEFDDLEVKGDINLRGQGGVTVKSELLNDNSFVSALRSKILEQGTKEETGGQ
jgi:hypothetical protein